ncbi:hypothetical protein ACTHGU_20545 [Chitinophagaceae bacterium MMS25-I14]
MPYPGWALQMPVIPATGCPAEHPVEQGRWWTLKYTCVAVVAAHVAIIQRRVAFIATRSENGKNCVAVVPAHVAAAAAHVAMTATGL